MENKCVHAIVRGRVQGVFFRDYTRQQADKLCLRGWVRNLNDGSVETVFAGEAGAVEQMLAWLQTGSPLSEVTAVESREESLDNRFSSFTIRYS